MLDENKAVSALVPFDFFVVAFGSWTCEPVRAIAYAIVIGRSLHGFCYHFIIIFISFPPFHFRIIL